MKVKIKKLNPNAVIPSYAKEGDGAVDLTATSHSYDKDLERHEYGFGIAIEVPKGHVGLIFPRSSICKKDLRLTNAVGIIDSGFQGEIKAVFDDKGFSKWNTISMNLYRPGERIAQLIIMPIPSIEFEEVNDFDKVTERGTGGFGSSNKKG